MSKKEWIHICRYVYILVAFICLVFGMKRKRNGKWWASHSSRYLSHIRNQTWEMRWYINIFDTRHGKRWTYCEITATTATTTKLYIYRAYLRIYMFIGNNRLQHPFSTDIQNNFFSSFTVFYGQSCRFACFPFCKLLNVNVQTNKKDVTGKTSLPLSFQI